MELDDIDSLMAELMNLQQTKSNPLSERTLIQLLLKLPSFGLVFYQTTDGNQYVTQQALDATIVQTIKERGRVLSGELPQIIGVNLDVIEGRLNLVCNKYGLTKVDDKLMSPRYLDELISNLREQIQTKGKMTMQQIILDVSLPGVFIRKLVEERIQQLNSDLVKDVFVTKQYKQKLRSQLTGILNGVLKPASLSALLKRFSIQDESVNDIIEELGRKGKINGKLQHDCFIPKRFQQNQNSLIQSWLQSNNYIQYSQLQKNFFITKPKQWIKTNLGSKVILLDDSAFSTSAIESSRSNLLSLIKQQGFAELSKVFPSFTDDDVEMLFNEHLKLSHLILTNGYCFDPQWLDKCCNAFRQKIIYNIFFKVQDPKNKKKKKSKITIQEMKQLILENDLVEYNTLQDIQEILYQQLCPRIQTLYKECSNELTQAKGIVTANMLKYKKGKTILPTKQRCLKFCTTLQKQCKKTGKKWTDPQFGITADDTQGLLSVLYFDKIPPKDWSVDNLTWQEVDKKDSKQLQDIISNKYLQKCKVSEAIKLLDEFNRQYPNVVGFPFIQSQFTQFQQHGIYVFVFQLKNQQKKYVLVDDKIPVINGKVLSTLSSQSWLALVEKAYAKLRYCYKGILNTGFSTVLQQLSGLSVIKKISSTSFKQQLQQFFQSVATLKGKAIIIGITQGQIDTSVDFDGQASGFKSNRAYLIKDAKQQQIGNQTLKLFKVQINAKCHESLVIKPEDSEKSQWLKNINKSECILNSFQTQCIFKSIYIFGTQ